MAAPPKKVGGEGTKRGGTESSPIRRRSRRHFDPNNETCAMINEGNYGSTRPSDVAFNRRRSSKLGLSPTSYMAASFR